MLITHGAKLAVQGDIGSVGDLFALATAGESETLLQSLATGDSKVVSYLFGKAATDDGLAGTVSNGLLKGGQVVDGIMGKISGGLDKVVSWNNMFADKTVADTAVTDAMDKEADQSTSNIGESLEGEVQKVAVQAQDNAGSVTLPADEVCSCRFGY